MEAKEAATAAVPFRMQFSGLVTHFHEGEVWRIVTLQAPGHSPRLVVHRNHVIDAQGFPDHRSGEFRRFEINDVEFSTNLPAGKPAKSGNFDNHVPSLTHVLDKAVDPQAVQGKREHAGVSASVALGAGTMAPTGCFAKRVTWKDATNPLPACLACAVTYTVTFPGEPFPITFRDATNASSFIMLRSDAQVWIVNSGAGTGHFPMYALLAKDGKAVRVPTADGGSCVGCVPRDAAPDDSIDCSVPTAVRLQSHAGHDEAHHHSEKHAATEASSGDRTASSDRRGAAAVGFLVLPDFDCSNSQYP